MLAKDVMTTELRVASPDTSVGELASLMLEHRVSGIPIVDEANRLLGLVTEGDLLRRPETGGEPHRSWWLRLLSEPGEAAIDYVHAHGRHARDVMTTPVATVQEDTGIAEIADMMQRRRIKRVPVLRDGKLVGMVARLDLLRTLATSIPVGTGPVSDDDLRQRVEAKLASVSWSANETVTAEVDDGVVKLIGMVGSAGQRQGLRVLVENVPGVQGYTDELTVRPSTYLA